MTQRFTMVIGSVAIVLLIAVLVGIFSLLYARPATAQTGVGVTGLRQVTVIGEGEIKGRPDTAVVQIGVETNADTSQEALQQNNTQAQAIQTRLSELGVAENDIQTSNFSISPMYDYRNDTPVLRGYQVSNIVSVTIRNLDEAGTLLDEVVQVGANSIYGISFRVDDPKELLNQARQQAVADARERANQLAQAANASVGDVLVITENIGSNVQPIFREAAPMMEDAASAVPVQPGEQSFTVNIQVTFELR